MQVDDLVLVSVDDHVVEPPDHVPREQATVGSLRAQATDVDTTPVNHGPGKFQEEGVVTAMTLAERMART
jgi:hypothetical protein